MKVYARYYEDNGKTYRLSTILQFGSSWDVIGSVVLLNPGSAIPLGSRLDNSILQNISAILECEVQPGEWQEFSPDQTIANVQRLFQGQKLGYNRELNGVVLLLNLFNRRDADSVRAVSDKTDNQYVYSSSILSEIEILKRCSPTYLGWGRLHDSFLIQTARTVFDELLPQNDYLDPVFEKNCFRHLSPKSYNMIKKDSEAYKYLERFFKECF